MVDTMDKEMAALGIGIETLNGIKNMATVIPMADTKKDVIFILQTMIDELDSSLKEIDNLIELNKQ
jgi:hypothetical protein